MRDDPLTRTVGLRRGNGARGDEKDVRSGDQHKDVLASQLGQVDLFLHVVDLDLDVGDGIADFERGGRGQIGESLVGRLGGSLDDGCCGEG